jgi:MOSC domain-containing protein YiiM
VSAQEAAGRLRAIWVKRAKGGPMDPALAGVLVAGRGLAGNANQGGRRQVVVIEEERWTEALADLGSRLPTGLGVELPPSTRRANLMVSGLPLARTRGRILRIGSCRLRIWTECNPCYQMDEACPGLQQALRPEWRGGACAEILEGGAITLGDAVDWVE